MEIVTKNFQEVHDITTDTVAVGADVVVERVTTTTSVGGQSEVQRIRGPKLNEREVLCVVEPELLEKLRSRGWFIDSDDYEMISKTPFSRVVSGKPFEVVRLCTYDHSLCNMAGERLPVGLNFDSINGYITDKNFDLEALLEHLKKQSHVTINANSRNGSLIQSDLYDNRRYISFTWGPPVDLYRDYLSRISPETAYFSRYEVALTMLGCDEFRLEPKNED